MNDQNRIDRRSALRRAATVGAIAWTAPTIMSSTASAGSLGACTPKCVPQFGSGTALTVSQSCFDPDPGDIVQIVGTPVHSCPCGVGSGVFAIAARGRDSSLRVSNQTATEIFIDAFPGDTLPPGTPYNGSIDYTATCFDRQQNAIETVSTFAVSFTTLTDPCTDGFETTIAASEGTVSDPTCIVDQPDGG